jgi:hypothetical protein
MPLTGLGELAPARADGPLPPEPKAAAALEGAGPLPPEPKAALAGAGPLVGALGRESGREPPKAAAAPPPRVGKPEPPAWLSGGIVGDW